MKKQLNKLIALMAIFIAFTACNQESKSTGFVVKGEIEGLNEGTVLYTPEKDAKPLEFKITEGKFEIKSDRKFDEPTNVYFKIKGDNNLRFGLYIEDGESTYKGKIESRMIEGYGEYKSIKTLSIKGSIVNEHIMYLQNKTEKARELIENLSDLSVEERDAAIVNYRDQTNEIQLNFIKEHPKAYYSAVLIRQMAHGMDASGLKELLSYLDPSNNYAIVLKLKEDLAEMEKTDVKIEDIINVENVTYKVDKSFKGANHKNIVYLGMLSNNNICAIDDENLVQIIDINGNKLQSFKTNLETKATALAVDNKDNIFILNPVQDEKEITYRGRKQKRTETVAYNCTVFNAKGEKQRSFSLENVQTATGARIMNGKLLIADYRNRIIAIFDSKTGTRESAIEGMRPCCGILDFSVNDKNEVLVANLGAFRVQAYDLSGKQLLAFGKRGKELTDFHGCCNPVSVAYLSNGAIVTVEKDPTRIKIFSADGAKQIDGVQELVKGCSYIPMIVDGNDNLYMASKDKGMIKCVSI